MTNAEFKKQALDDLEAVKNDHDLSRWHDANMGGEEYLHLSQPEVIELEEAFRAKARWIWGVDA